MLTNLDKNKTFKTFKNRFGRKNFDDTVVLPLCSAILNPRGIGVYVKILPFRLHILPKFGLDFRVKERYNALTYETSAIVRF